MKVHIIGTRNSSQPAELLGDYRGWMPPAWMWSCILGSVVAITTSAAVAAFVSTYLAEYRSGVHRLVAVELTALCAVLEGAVIGYFQWRVLRRLFPTMSSVSWVGATLIAAALGCVLSWIPTSYALTVAVAGSIGDITPGPAVMARLLVVTGALVGLVWGSAQYAVLRLHAYQAGSWITASVLAWTGSFVALYLAASVPERTTTSVVHIALGALSGFVLGLSLGLLQGRVLSRLHSRLLSFAHN